MSGKAEAIIEFTRVGSVVRVTAVDAATGIEAVIQGPASAGEGLLREAALKKLSYLLARQKG
ncbi:MAG: hypothetical protein AB7G06_08200 [Bdellovibrionales bacterium]